MSTMNGYRPRDGPPPAGFQNVTGDDAAHGVHFAGWDVDDAGVGVLRERHYQSPSPSPRGRPPMKTSGLGPNILGRETVDDVARPTGSTFHDPFRPCYDQRVPPGHVPQGRPEASEGPTFIPIVQPPGTHPAVPPDVAPRMHDPDDQGLYNLSGGLSDVAQPRLDNHASFPLPQGSGLTHTSALGVQPPLPAFDGEHAFLTSIYYGDRGVGSRDHGPPALFTSTPGPASFYGAGDVPTTRDYRFGPEQPLSPPFGEGPSQPRTTGPSPSIPLSTSPSTELGSRGGKPKPPNTPLASGVATKSRTAHPGSRLIASGGLPDSGQYRGKGKRKRSSDEPDGGMIRGLPRPRRNMISGDSLQNCQIPLRPFPRRIKIEQPPYVCGNSQHNWVQQNPINFAVNGQSGIKLTDALDRHFSGPDGRDDRMLQYDGAGSSISCRLSFPGYPPRSSQITTADHKKTRNPRTRKKLAFEVAKRVKRYVEELKVDMRFEDMVLTKLIHVSRASWQPEVWYEQGSAGNP